MGFIGIVVLVLLTNMYIEIFKDTPNSFYYSYFVSPGSRFLEQGVPRVTGIGRMIVLIIILNSIILINYKHKYISFTILLILSASLFLTQARGAIAAFIMLGIFLCLFDKNYNFFKKIIIFIFILTFGLSFQMLFPKIKGMINVYSDFISTQNIEANVDDSCKINLGFSKCEQDIISKNWKSHRENEIAMQYRVRIISYFGTSGRFNDWKKLLNFAVKKPILGYGFQADRHLIKASASNSYIYALITSGLIGLILFLIIIYSATIKCLKIIFINKLFNEKGKIILKTCLLVNIFILARTLIESSFATHNFDLVIFLLTYLYIENYERNIKKDFN